MRKTIIKLGGFLVCLLFFQIASFADIEGLYFTLPQIDGSQNQSFVEAGASGSFQVHYKKTAPFNAATWATGAMLYFNFDKNVVESINFVLNPAFAGHLSIGSEVKADNQYQIQIIATAADQGVEVGPDLLLGTFTFKIKDNLVFDQDLLVWNINWELNQDFVNISLFENKGGNSLGLDNIKTNPANWQIEKKFAPNFAGVKTVANPNPAPGNTLNIGWSIDDADANDKVGHNAATYYAGGPGGAGLKYKVYRDNVLVNQTNPGVSSYTNAGLNDNQEYTFKVHAIDDCGIPNESTEQPEVTKSEKPHDYQPPGANIQVTAIKNQEIDLSWGTDDQNDLGGYILAKKELALTDPDPATPVFVGASEDNNGLPLNLAVKSLIDNGFTILKQETLDTTIADTPINNSKKHFYVLYAYDKVGGNPVNQGYNYSKAAVSAAPGVQPEPVKNFIAISRKKEKEISLKWENPGNQAAKPQGGTVVWYTNNVATWQIIPENPADWTTPQKMAEIFPFAVQAKNAVGNNEELTTANLATDKTFYFKAFTYNANGLPLALGDLADANKLNMYKFSSGVTAAAMSTLGLGDQLIENKWTFNPPAAGAAFGINTFSYPFDTNKKVYRTNNANGFDIKTLGDLIKEIDNQAVEKNKIKVIGFYDTVNKKPVGLSGVTIVTANNAVTIDGTKIGVANVSDILDHPLDPKETYQISINAQNPINVTLSGNIKTQ